MQGSDGLFLKDRAPQNDGDLSFAVMASHELKSPLALLRQLSLALEADTMSDEERLHLARRMTLTSERALRLTTDLTRASRLEGSLFEVEPLNPRQLCEDVVHELTPLYKAKGREIRVASKYRPLLVVANRDLLRRIILNFGDNALHYADVAAPVELKVTSMQKSGHIRLGVRDYGPAIPTDVWGRLRQHLGTSAQLLHARPQASGLGLYVAGQFAAAMNGSIGATRHHDGVTFYVDLAASTQMRLL